MWIVNREGFFSVVVDEFCESGMVVVRARVKKDLDNLLEKIGHVTSIYEFEEADYLYRIYLLKEIWADYLSDAAMKINYKNFKNEVHGNGKVRDRAYMGVWSALHALQAAPWDRTSDKRKPWYERKDWVLNRHDKRRHTDEEKGQ